MKMIQKRYTLSLVTVVMAFIAQSLLAVDGTWTGLSGGSWTNTANWASGVVADGSAGIADFSTLNITANTYVTLDGPRIIGSLLFKDDVAASHNWTLATGSGGELTLDVGSGSPVINVVNRTAEISAVLTGNDGLTKTGTGALTISGRSNLSGEIFVNQGLLTSTLGGLRDTTGDITVADGATLYLTSGWGDNDGRYDITNSIYISGMGVQTSFGALQGQANLKCQGLVTLLSDAEISQDWNNFYIQGGVNGIDKDLTLRAANAASQPGLQMQSSISLGSGAISVVGSGYVTLYNANNYRGGTIVDVGGSGSLKVEHADALGSGGLTVNNGPVDLRGKSVTLAWLSGSGGEITDTKSGGGRHTDGHPVD